MCSCTMYEVEVRLEQAYIICTVNELLLPKIVSLSIGVYVAFSGGPVS